MKKIFVGNDLFCFKAMRFEGKTHHCQLPTRRGMMHGKATSCEKGRRHRLANGPLPARKILADPTQGDFLCPRTTTCAEQPPPLAPFPPSHPLLLFARLMSLSLSRWCSRCSTPLPRLPPSDIEISVRFNGTLPHLRSRQGVRTPSSRPSADSPSLSLSLPSIFV